jgi:hypothetical protein
LDDDDRLRNALDRETVQHVQSRCPGASLEDFDYLQRLMQDRRIFSAVDDEPTRQQIWARLCKIDYLIPTLGSLQQDFKYLRAPALAMQELLKPPQAGRKGRKTLRQMAWMAFSGGRDGAKSYDGDLVDQFETKFQDLYLYAMRYVFDMGYDCPLKASGKRAPTARPSDPVVWYGFASFAHTLGFDSLEVRRLKARDPYVEKARQTFLGQHARTLNPTKLEQLMEDVAKIYRTAAEEKPPECAPRMLLDGYGEQVSRRRGRHPEDAYERDRHYMFLEVFMRPLCGRGKSVSSLFVRRSVFWTFFPFPIPKSGGADSTGDRPSNNNASAEAVDADGDVVLPDRNSSVHSPQASEAGSDTSMQSTEAPVAASFTVTHPVSNIASIKRKVRRLSTSSTSASEPPQTSWDLQIYQLNTWARKRPRIEDVHVPDGSVAREGTASTPTALASAVLIQTALQSVNEVDNDLEASPLRLELPSNSPSPPGAAAQPFSGVNPPGEVTVVVYGDLDHKTPGKEVARCSNRQEVEETVNWYLAQYPCYLTTRARRAIMRSECYDLAISGDGCVYLTIDPDLNQEL